MKPERREPDCATCIHRGDCAVAQSIRDQHPDDPRFADGTMWGVFCAQWQSEAPRPDGPDPNDAWNRGEDAVL